MNGLPESKTLLAGITAIMLTGANPALATEELREMACRTLKTHFDIALKKAGKVATRTPDRVPEASPGWYSLGAPYFYFLEWMVVFDANYEDALRERAGMLMSRARGKSCAWAQ